MSCVVPCQDKTLFKSSFSLKAVVLALIMDRCILTMAQVCPSFHLVTYRKPRSISSAYFYMLLCHLLVIAVWALIWSLCPFLSPLQLSPIILPISVRLHSFPSLSTLTHRSYTSLVNNHLSAHHHSYGHHQFCCPSRPSRPKPPASLTTVKPR